MTSKQRRINKKKCRKERKKRLHALDDKCWRIGLQLHWSHLKGTSRNDIVYTIWEKGEVFSYRFKGSLNEVEHYIDTCLKLKSFL